MINLLKKIFLVIFMLLITFFGYVMIVNRNTKNMTGRQMMMKAMYPVIMWVNKISGKGNKALTHDKTQAPIPFYSLNIVLNDGSTLNLASLKGKKVMLVNTASDCGYTGQYEQLQELYSKHQDKLVIVGFPANDFKEQEKGSNEEIASFCKKNYGVSFPLAQKSVVIKSPQQNEVFQWLTDPAKNGWNSQEPSWNFCKYILDENGVLLGFFPSGIEPTGKEINEVLHLN